MSDEQSKKDYFKYLDTHVNIVMKPMLVDILKSKTENVCDFIINWCQTKGKEIEENRKANKQNYDRSHLPQSDDSFEEMDEEDEKEEEQLKKLKAKQRKTKKKQAISAEAYGEYNKLGDFNPRVIEKTDEQKELIKSILMKNFMFSSLDEKNQAIIIKAMEIKNYKKGDTIIKQGDDGEELFIVCTGVLKCTRIMKEGEEETFLKNYESGEVFGELALMYNAPRAANIYAEKESKLFSLDRDTFNHIVKTAAIKNRQKFDGFLQKIDILSTLNNYEREKICDCLKTQNFKKGDIIIKQGEEGDDFYLIQEGNAEAVQVKDGKEEIVFKYGENDYFGELSLLNGDKRKASIRVTSDTMCVAFMSQDSFKRMLGPIEEILKRNISKYEKYVENN